MKHDVLELYLHIPFCVAKCVYCDFLSAPGTDEAKLRYVKALCEEIAGRQDEFAGRPITSVFLGGGTPSCLPEGCVAGLFDTLRKYGRLEQDAEVTIEVNPGTVTPQKLAEYRQAGINRLSIGLQSAREEELRLLGRIHGTQEFLDAFGQARECGFRNISVDLMSGIPRQSWETFRESLELVTGLADPPEHLSVYSLILEEGTPFYDTYAGGQEALLPEEEDRRIYHETASFLEKCGYRRYEISNYARAGFECRHNLGYWMRTPYLGFGIGAASLMQGRRFRNKSSLSEYLANPLGARETTETLTKEDEMSEFAFLGLRLTKGISRRRFEDAFQVPFEAVFGDVLEKNKKDGLLAEEGDRVFLTEYGTDIGNYVMSQFLL